MTGEHGHRIDPHRRKLLTTAVAGALILASGPAKAAIIRPRPVRRLSMYNLHTGERLSAVYWADGAYVPEALADIHRLLRDHRTGEVHPIHPDVLDILNLLQNRLETDAPFHIVSGYRSPKTNALLRASGGGGVAKKSLHMQGQAIDVRVPRRSVDEVAKAAKSLRMGGVGTYRKSNFVHIDNGRVRYW